MSLSTAEPSIAASAPAVARHPHGHFELAHKPAAEDLADYYAHKYYQQSLRTHRPAYDEAESRWRTLRLQQKLHMAQRHLGLSAQGGRFLDVGAGEGFAMAFFDAAGWHVCGLDHSRHACETHHPQLLDRLHCGDIDATLQDLQAQGARFELILLDNVLEHLLAPQATLQRLRALLAPGGLLIVEVPNDFSALQQHLLAQGHIDQPFWVVAPDHISYFNAEGLEALCRGAGLQQLALLADFPIDLALLNPHSNYVRDKSKGPAAHAARREADTLLDSISRDAALQFYQALAKLGLGRSLLGYYRAAAAHEHAEQGERA